MSSDDYILLSVNWKQSGAIYDGISVDYNSACPIDPVTQESCLTGCTNTAAGMIIYYWLQSGKIKDFSLTLTFTDSYTSRKDKFDQHPIRISSSQYDVQQYGYLSFSEVNDRLRQCNLTTGTQENAELIAALIFTCGVIQQAIYSSSNTATAWNDSVFERSGLGRTTYYSGLYYSNYFVTSDYLKSYTITDAGFEVLIENLTAGRPVGVSYAYADRYGNYNGHALVIDGYDPETDQFHFNFGWGPDYVKQFDSARGVYCGTGWYTREEMNAGGYYEFLLDITPDVITEPITVSTAQSYGVGTLMRAVERAYASVGENEIVFDEALQGKTVFMYTYDLSIRETVSFQNWNMDIAVHSDTQSSCALYVYEGDLTLSMNHGSLAVDYDSWTIFCGTRSGELNLTLNASGLYAGRHDVNGEDGDRFGDAVREYVETGSAEKAEIWLQNSTNYIIGANTADDTVILQNRSIAAGSINLDSGSDTLIIRDSILYGDVWNTEYFTIDNLSFFAGDFYYCQLSAAFEITAAPADHAVITINQYAYNFYSSLSSNSISLHLASTPDIEGTHLLIDASNATYNNWLDRIKFNFHQNDVCLSEGLPCGSTFENDKASYRPYFENGCIYLETALKYHGSADGLVWAKKDDAATYQVEYSKDNFNTSIAIVLTASQLQTYALSAGEYTWRYRASTDTEWTRGQTITSSHDSAVPKLFQGTQDTAPDVFFATPSEVWSKYFAACYCGTADNSQIVSIDGKNRFTGLFEGNTDANILYLTDTENGDAFFLDDQYTDLPQDLTEQRARVVQIHEIRSGKGDDLIDLSSEVFTDSASAMIIRGGSGNDIIWAGDGEYLLFGDEGEDCLAGSSGHDVIAGGSGNDTLLGGGGNDTFCFCENWGIDTVTQSQGGSVVLWFASGSSDKWNADTMTYSDGTNSVFVSGVSADSVFLIFGNDESEDYARFAALGAFDSFTTDAVFEEEGKGITAILV